MRIKSRFAILAILALGASAVTAAPVLAQSKAPAVASAPAHSKAPAKSLVPYRAQAVANCSIVFSNIWVDAWNYVNAQAFLRNCTAAVTKVRFMWDGSHLEGFWDKSECGPCVLGNLRYYETSAPGIPLTINNVVPSGNYGVTLKTYGWCSPGGVHQVANGIWWQIFNSTAPNGGSWGNPHDTISAFEWTHCGNI